MTEVYWKAFKVGDLFERSNDHQIKISIKETITSDIKTKEYCVANVTSCTDNNGIACWLKNDDDVINKKKKDFLTIATDGVYAGTTFYQDMYFVSTGHNNIIKLKTNIPLNRNGYLFLANTITTIFQNKYHGFQRSISAGNDFDREIILLPVKQCEEQNAVWHEEDGTPLTLDTETIERIMNRIEERKKDKTINTYVAMRAKYELERAKYVEDPAFLEKYGKMFWKSFKVGDLFERSNDHQIKASIKELITSDVKTKEFCIANITSSSVNNGIACYLKDEGEITSKKKKGYITIATDGYAGACFYQNDYFVSSGHNNILASKITLNLDSQSASFIAKQIQKVLQNKYHGFQRSISCGNDFDREIILLPVIKNDNNEDEIFTDAMSYLYLSSMVLKYQKKIDDYNNKINILRGNNNGQE